MVGEIWRKNCEPFVLPPKTKGGSAEFPIEKTQLEVSGSLVPPSWCGNQVSKND